MNRRRAPRGPAAVLAAIAVSAAACGTGTTGSPVAVTGSATSAVTSAPAPSGDGVPESLLLPDEGGRSTTAEFTDWTTDNTLERVWLLDPCQPTAYPTDQQRLGFRTVEREGPEAHDARQLAVYPTAEVAAEVLAGFRRALEACRTGQVRDTPWTWVSRDVPDLGDEGLLAASTFGAGQQAAYGDRIAVTRSGSMVFLAYAFGEYYTAEIDGGTESAQEVAQRFLDSL
jgi:hypothetical protein